MKKYLLFDHDGVLVDTEFWYYKAGERALADIGLTLDKDQYLRDMNQGLGTWAQARSPIQNHFWWLAGSSAGVTTRNGGRP